MNKILRKIIKDYELKELTTMKVGGKAKFFIAPSHIEEILDAIEFSQKAGIEPFILGGGSNCIFEDGTIEKLIISTRKLTKIEIKENLLIAGAGVLTSELLKKCETEELSGLEFIVGVPASVGGMVCMNYGSMGKEISHYLKSIIAIENGKIKVIEKDKINFSYRKGYKKGIIILVEFELRRENLNEIRKIRKKILSIKKEKQPLNKRTAGCIFKNPPEHFAGKLIEDAGLKGFKIGDAMVSLKHANFIENTGKASFQDIKSLIKYIKDKVYEKFNVELEEEVILVEK